MSDVLGTNLDGSASIDATFANIRTAAIAKASDLAAVAPLAPPTPTAASPEAAAALPTEGTPAALPSVNTPPVFGQPQQEPPVAPVADPPPAPDLTPSEQQVLDLPDTGMFRITVAGQEMVVSGAEAKKRMMLHADYTRKTQAVAAKERMLGEALGLDPQKIDANTLQQFRGVLSEHQQMSQILSNQELYSRYGSEVFKPNAGSTPNAAPVPSPSATKLDPNAIVSYGDVRGLVDNTTQAIEAKLAELRQQSEDIPKNVAQQVQAEIQRLEDARESVRMRGQVEGTINQVVQQHPILNAIPNLVDLVKFETYKMQPRTEQELYHSTQTVLAGILEGIETAQAQRARVDAAKKAQVLSQGIEPPSGTAPSLKPAPKLDAKDPKYWDNLAHVAKAYRR